MSLVYAIGYAACQLFPRRFCYRVARRIADWHSERSASDRQAVAENLKAVLRVEDVSPDLVREVFRNFSMYLVDFFRFGHLTRRSIERSVRIEGLEHMKQALAAGCGAIGLTAHLGNYELAGAVLSILGLPVNAVVLTHQNRWIDSLFVRQRQKAGVKGIPIQTLSPKESMARCLASLRTNEVLALVGDRDFLGHGLPFSLFGKAVQVPTGAATFSVRTSAPIVPGFLIRQEEGSYRFFLETPIVPPKGLPRQEAIRKMTQEGLNVMSRYIRRYPTQWYMFREFWNPGPALIL